jgi:hypothetical protein
MAAHGVCPLPARHHDGTTLHEDRVVTSDARRRDALTLAILLAFAALIFFLVRAQSPPVGSVSLIMEK